VLGAALRNVRSASESSSRKNARCRPPGFFRRHFYVSRSNSGTINEHWACREQLISGNQIQPFGRIDRYKLAALRTFGQTPQQLDHVTRQWLVIINIANCCSRREGLADSYRNVCCVKAATVTGEREVVLDHRRPVMDSQPTFERELVAASTGAK
jgi:hypothetical protein